MSSQHIFIIGAGVCGLAIAHGLQKANIPFTIFEAEEEDAFRPREWTMALHWGLPMLETLIPDDLAARLKVDAVVDPSLDYTRYPNNTIAIYDGVSGDLMKEMEIDGPSLRVSRRKLRAVCLQGVDVGYGYTLQRITRNPDTTTITAHFTNGANHTGTILIGTDGPRSVVRTHLFGPAGAAPTPIDAVYINVSFRYPHADQALFARSANPVCGFTVHPDCIAMISIQDVPDSERPETWRFQTVVSWREKGGKDRGAMTREERRREVREKVERLKEPFRSAIQWMPEDVDILSNDLAYWIPQPWDTHGGRVTLAGDAAHSMPPNRGQGLNHAINDALNFVEAVKKIGEGNVKQEHAIKAYSDEVALRGAKEVELSRDTAYLTLNYDGFKDSALMKHGVARAPE